MSGPTDKDALLGELESIHSYLADNELDGDDIPTLTIIANVDGSSGQSSALNEEREEHQHSANDSTSAQLELNTPLPNQTSFLIDEKSNLGDKATEVSKTKTSGGALRGSGENPFLPPHIRERLGRNKDIAEQYKSALAEKKRVEVQGDLLDGFTESDEDIARVNVDESQPASSESCLKHPKTNTLLTEFELNALIDETVAEALPKLETRLREKLIEQLSLGKD